MTDPTDFEIDHRVGLTKFEVIYWLNKLLSFYINGGLSNPCSCPSARHKEPRICLCVAQTCSCSHSDFGESNTGHCSRAYMSQCYVSTYVLKATADLRMGADL